MFIPPTTQVTPPPATEDPVTQPWLPIQQQTVMKNAQRRRFLVSFDPRRRMKLKNASDSEEPIKDIDSNNTATKQSITTTKSPALSTKSTKRTVRNRNRNLRISTRYNNLKTERESQATSQSRIFHQIPKLKKTKQNIEKPVTINIGGTPIVIPNFDLKANVIESVEGKTRDTYSKQPKRATLKHSLLRPNRKKLNTRITTSPKTVTQKEEYLEKIKPLTLTTSKSPVSKINVSTIRTTKQRSRKKSKTPVVPKKSKKLRAINTTQQPVIVPVDPACTGGLEGCVDSCSDLDDVYAYSSCVVVCGDAC